MKPIIECITPSDLAALHVKLGLEKCPDADWRIDELLRRQLLRESTSVVELGAHKGGLTALLARTARIVIAVEGQLENIVAGMIGVGIRAATPKVQWEFADVESEWEHPLADVYFHCGVLYHLWNPMPQLRKTLDAANETLLLDTHYAKSPTVPYRGLMCEIHDEGRAPRNGLHEKSRWLGLDDILSEVRPRFPYVTVYEREERNGPRATIIATRRRGA